MKLSDLYESPLGDYRFYDPDRDIKEPKRDKRNYSEFQEPEVKKLLTQRLKHVPYRLNFYFYKDYVNGVKNNNLRHIVDAPPHDDVYVTIDKDEIKKFFKNPDIEKEIRSGSNDISVVFLSLTKEDESFTFKRTPWALIHDFIHGITLSTNKQYELIEKSDRLLEQTYSYIYKKPKNYSPSMKELRSFYSEIGTMKSAEVVRRPEEFTTELFTQYIYTTKGIVFNVPKNTRVVKGINEVMNDLKNKLEILFNEILREATGYIYISAL